MLSLLAPSGLDLVANPPTAVALKATSDTGLNYTLAVLAVENDPNLPSQQVQVTVDWNDGQLPVTYPYALTANGTMSINTVRALSLGDHVIGVSAQNLRAPQADSANVNFEVTVLPRLQFSVPAKLIFGPILPKDQGFPNPQQWNFDTGSDIDILDSSVKMLLSTAKGERIMLPSYGTNLRLMLFQPITEGMQEMAQQEIVDALTNWEPRVILQSLAIVRNADQSINVNCVMLSKLTQQNFNSSLVFTP